MISKTKYSKKKQSLKSCSNNVQAKFETHNKILMLLKLR